MDSAEMTLATSTDFDAFLVDYIPVNDGVWSLAGFDDDRSVFAWSSYHATRCVEQRALETEQAIAASDRDSLAKQVGVLTEALKSTAIDVTKILSSEVSDTAWDAYLSKLNTMKWWLYPTGTSGTPVTSPFGSAYKSINVSTYTKRDSAGLNGIEWITKFYYDQYYKPNPAADGFFMDNVLWMPNVDGDWNRDGTTDSRTAAISGTCACTVPTL